MIEDNFTAELYTWCKQNKIISKFQTNFWLCYDEYKNNNSQEFLERFKDKSINSVSISLSSVKFCLNYINKDEKPTVEVDGDILLDGQSIGLYREVYFTNGELVDDFFIIK